MPLITVSLYPGRSDEQKKLFVEKITEYAVASLFLQKNTITKK